MTKKKEQKKEPQEKFVRVPGFGAIMKNLRTLRASVIKFNRLRSEIENLRQRKIELISEFNSKLKSLEKDLKQLARSLPKKEKKKEEKPKKQKKKPRKKKETEERRKILERRESLEKIKKELESIKEELGV